MSNVATVPTIKNVISELTEKKDLPETLRFEISNFNGFPVMGEQGGFIKRLGMGIGVVIGDSRGRMKNAIGFSKNPKPNGVLGKCRLNVGDQIGFLRYIKNKELKFFVYRIESFNTLENRYIVHLKQMYKGNEYDSVPAKFRDMFSRGNILVKTANNRIVKFMNPFTNFNIIKKEKEIEFKLKDDAVLGFEIQNLLEDVTDDEDLIPVINFTDWDINLNYRLLKIKEQYGTDSPLVTIWAYNKNKPEITIIVLGTIAYLTNYVKEEKQEELEPEYFKIVLGNESVKTCNYYLTFGHSKTNSLLKMLKNFQDKNYTLMTDDYVFVFRLFLHR